MAVSPRLGSLGFRAYVLGCFRSLGSLGFKVEGFRGLRVQGFREFSVQCSVVLQAAEDLKHSRSLSHARV